MEKITTPMRTSLLALALTFSVLFTPWVSNVQASPHPAANKLKIATSMSIPEDVVKSIAGDAAEVLSIVSGTEDPHTYSGPTPSEKDFLENADIVVIMGLEGLEPWWAKTYASLTNRPTIVQLVPASMMRVDPLSNVNNPHVWMDPNNVKQMGATVLDALISADAGNSATYTANALAYNQTLDTVLTWIQGNRTQFEGMKVVVHHTSFIYLFDLLGIQRVGAIEEKHGEEPSAEHIDTLVQTMKEQNVAILVNQIGLDEKDVGEIARETGAKIVDGTPLLGVKTSESVITSYVDLIDYNLWALANPHEPSGQDIPGFSIVLVFMAGCVAVALATWKY